MTVRVSVEGALIAWHGIHCSVTVCVSVEDDVVKCVLDSLHALVDTPYCQEAKGMDSLLTVQIRTIFEEYDNYCAHG